MAVAIGCQNTAVVGFRASDGAVDASVDAFTEPVDGSTDGGGPSDGRMPEDGFANDGGRLTAPCARPWALMMANGSDGSFVARSSLAGAEPVPCDPLFGEGTLPSILYDVEALDEDTVVVVGPGAVRAIDVRTDTVRWSTLGEVAARDAQAFVLRSDPPWVGVAWWVKSSRAGTITGYSSEGERTEWTWPVEVVGAAAHPDPRYVYASGWDNGLFVIAPFSGMIVEELDALSLWKLHTLVGDDPPRVAGGQSGSLRMGEISDPPLLFARVIDGCAVRESAPAPGDPNLAIVRCGETMSSVILVDVITDEFHVLIEPDAANPRLTVTGISVFE